MTRPFLSRAFAPTWQADEWPARLDEFNSCTGAAVEVDYPSDEDHMAAFILSDVGTQVCNVHILAHRCTRTPLPMFS